MASMSMSKLLFQLQQSPSGLLQEGTVRGQLINKFFVQLQLIIQFVSIDLFKLHCMRSSNYQCVNCQLDFEIEDDYLSHYRSEHHRYNIKRKLIGLCPLSLVDYQLQFQYDVTSKESSVQDFRCEICSKNFMSMGPYKHHLNSKKHKNKRDKATAPDTLLLSKSSSSSNFSVIGAEKVKQCLFCQESCTRDHLKNEHSFPPFEDECMNFEGLLAFACDKIEGGTCIFCGLKFINNENVRKHMRDVGHCKLDISDFQEYEKFYLWKIEETSSEEEQQLVMESQEEASKQNESDVFENLNHPTLRELELRRLQKFKLTTTGAIVNGKEVGYRHLKGYYKQYLGRVLENDRAKYQPAIESSNYKGAHLKNDRQFERPPHLNQIINSR